MMKNKLFYPLYAIIVSLIVVAAIISPQLKILSAKEAMSSDAAVIPKFMLFVTDAEYGAELKNIVHKLEKEYKGRAEISVMNVDQNKSLLNSFPVDGNTPAVIMTDELGDVCGIHFKTDSYDTMRIIIEDAINNKNEG